jgi:cytochrome c oxidase cbb3-type subunit 3/ubiquinol-cytochrome c reductase cytochrome c subunit
MKSLRPSLFLLLSSLTFAAIGCHGAPGKPGPEPDVPRPDDVLDFSTLYKQNCVACHGDAHQYGAALTLANPVYLAIAGEGNIKSVLTHGVPGKLMPAFAQSGGGMLTDRQVEVLAHGLVVTWGKSDALGGAKPPPYHATLQGDAAAGGKAFASYCAECHGATGEGNPDQVKGSIVDPSFLALISDQNLRSTILGGLPERMPDWQSHGDHPMTDEDVTNIVAWLGSHREMTEPADPQPPAKATAQTHQEPHS